MKKQNNKYSLLTKDEIELEQSLKSEKWESIKDLKSWKKELQEAAQTTIDLRKSKKITLRVNQEDLYRLKANAIQKSIPYQTLLNVLIRDYVKGHYSIKP